MTKPHRSRLILGAMLLAAAAIGAGLIVFSENEPTYDGKRLSKCLDEFAALDFQQRWHPDTKQAQAVRAIGTNALPWLLRELRSDGSRWQYQINKALARQPLIKYRFPDINDRLSRATIGFQALGELAEPALPALLDLVEDKPGFVPSALAGIGPASVPALQQCLTNTRAYTSSAGQVFTPIPGNTIGAIHNAMNGGRLRKTEIAGLVPLIRDWAAQTTNQNASLYAINFLKTFEHE